MSAALDLQIRLPNLSQMYEKDIFDCSAMHTRVCYFQYRCKIPTDTYSTSMAAYTPICKHFIHLKESGQLAVQMVQMDSSKITSTNPCQESSILQKP